MKLSEDLQWRGLLHQTTFKDPADLDVPRTFYLGVDPSSDSMTIGNLAIVLLVKRLAEHGHKVIVLVGGATGMIGDPKEDSERSLKTEDEIEKNKRGLAAQYTQILGDLEYEMVDNYDWFKKLDYLHFLRDVGKHFSMSELLDRDFVKSRIGEDKVGISYAEFSYSLIQGYDYLHLHREYGATLQIGGSDQWGNMLSGVSLIRKLDKADAHVLTIPLVVNKSTGVKFGKSEDGAVWLDEHKTSVFKFYQFWINADDEGVESYLKIYTELGKDEINDIMEAHNEARSNRLAQKHLAIEVTTAVHGKPRAEAVRNISEVLYGGADYSELTQADFAELESELTTMQVDNGAELAQTLVDCGLAQSKGEARRFLSSNAIYINGHQLPLEKTHFDANDFIDGYCVVRRGKNSTALIKQ